MKGLYVVTIYLKGGNKIDVVCEGWEFTFSDLTSEFVSYKFKGTKNYENLRINVSEISAYTAREYEGTKYK